MATLTPDEMQARVGTETVSDWVEVTQAMIDRFAEATGDHQFIHLEYFADLRVNRRVWFPTKVVFAIDVLYCMQHSDAGRIEPVVGAVGEHVWPTPSHSRQLIASRLL